MYIYIHIYNPKPLISSDAVTECQKHCPDKGLQKGPTMLRPPTEGPHNVAIDRAAPTAYTQHPTVRTPTWVPRS